MTTHARMLKSMRSPVRQARRRTPHKLHRWAGIEQPNAQPIALHQRVDLDRIFAHIPGLSNVKPVGGK